jgi:hypothetical protein
MLSSDAVAAISRRIQIEAAMKAIQPGWPFFLAEMQHLIEPLVGSLIAQNNDETRGRIKALRDLMNLPEALEAERVGILAAELPDEGSAL